MIDYYILLELRSQMNYVRDDRNNRIIEFEDGTEMTTFKEYNKTIEDVNNENSDYSNYNSDKEGRTNHLFTFNNINYDGYYYDTTTDDDNEISAFSIDNEDDLNNFYIINKIKKISKYSLSYYINQIFNLN